MDPSV